MLLVTGPVTRNMELALLKTWRATPEPKVVVAVGACGISGGIFGRNYAAEPDVLVELLRQDEAVAEADTLLLTVPNQLGVAYNAHVIEAILTHVAPALGWR